MANPFSHLADDRLMELYKKGEDMAFEVIYTRHKNRVYSYLNKRLTDSSLIDDTFQSIFVKFHKSRNLYNSDYPLLKWIYTICRSELLDAVKKRRAILVELKDEYITNKTEEYDLDPLDLNAEKSLTNNEKDALNLRYYSEKDFLEISKLLNTSESNTRKIISRGLKKLRAKYLGKTND